MGYGENGPQPPPHTVAEGGERKCDRCRATGPLGKDLRLVSIATSKIGRAVVSTTTMLLCRACRSEVKSLEGR